MSSNGSFCPLCLEPMDSKDVSFYPCPCLYQICVFCWTKILKEENGLCPACRKPYDSESPNMFIQKNVDVENKRNTTKRKKDTQNKRQICKETLKLLPELRVIQTNLVFVIGLPQWIAKEKDILKGPTYFGQFGKVFKVEVNSNQTFTGPQGQPSISAYITYCHAVDAMRAILSFDQSSMLDRQLRVSLGTTKYCSQFLKGHKCNKHECMYLHELGDPQASFTKVQMQAGKHTEYMNELLNSYMNQLPEERSATPTENLSSLGSVEKSTHAFDFEQKLRDKNSPVIFSTDANTNAHSRHFDQTLHKRLCNNAKPEESEHNFDSISPGRTTCNSNDLEASSSKQKPFQPTRKNFCRKYDTDGTENFAINAKSPQVKNQSRKWNDSLFSTSNDMNHLNAKNFSSHQPSTSKVQRHKELNPKYNTTVYASSKNSQNCAFPNTEKFQKKEFLPVVTRSLLMEPVPDTVPSNKFTSRDAPENTSFNFRNSEEQHVDIDFDPIRESQQGLAELLEAEKNNYPFESVSECESLGDIALKNLGELPNFQHFCIPSNRALFRSQETTNLSPVSLSTQTSSSCAPPPGFEDFHSDGCMEAGSHLPPYSFSEVGEQLNSTSPLSSSLFSSLDFNSFYNQMLETVCNQILSMNAPNLDKNTDKYVNNRNDYYSIPFFPPEQYSRLSDLTSDSLPYHKNCQHMVSNPTIGSFVDNTNNFVTRENQSEALKDMYRCFLQSSGFSPYANSNQSQHRNSFLPFSGPPQPHSKHICSETLLNGYSSSDLTFSAQLKFPLDVSSNSAVPTIQNTNSAQSDQNDFWMPSSFNHIAQQNTAFHEHKECHVEEPPTIFQQETTNTSTSKPYRNLSRESFSQNFSDYPSPRTYKVLPQDLP